ncbi:MAG: alpha/beta hydrolase fold protein [Gemmatimonadetes bacterium]|nr:alpha/beta hydrolase fold protein [Gemmatimonadota bacterium]
MKASLITALLLYAGFAAFAYFVSDRMIFLPPQASYRAGQLPVVMVPTLDGAQIATLYLPNPRATLTLLYSHGNAEDLGQLAPWLEQYRAAGFSVLAFDYRGYGTSTGGPPSADGAVRDMEAVYRHAVGTLGIQPASLVLFGRSVGSGPATELAARLPVGGLVIESGFVSAFRVLTRVALLPFDKFPNLRTIARVRCPVLVIHGTADEVISWPHGRRLFDAANQPKQALWIEGAHHNDVVPVGGARYWSALEQFAQQVGAARPTP